MRRRDQRRKYRGFQFDASIDPPAAAKTIAPAIANPARPISSRRALPSSRMKYNAVTKPSIAMVSSDPPRDRVMKVVASAKKHARA